jgi:hypothetical protein
MKRDGTKPVAASDEVAVATMGISKRSGKRGGACSEGVSFQGHVREKSVG